MLIKKENLEEVVKTFNSIVEKYKLPIIVSAHPRTINSLKNLIL